jgi:hypothetical protein
MQRKKKCLPAKERQSVVKVDKMTKKESCKAMFRAEPESLIHVRRLIRTLLRMISTYNR